MTRITKTRPPRATMCLLGIAGLLLAVLAWSPPALAGTAAAVFPAVGEVPDGVVLDGIPEFLGPLYRVDRTSLPELVVLVTLPIARDRDNWFAVVETCAAADEDTPPDMDACADAHPELLDNRDWTYFSLWRVEADGRMDLLAVSRQGRYWGETTAARIFLSQRSVAVDTLASWKSVLLSWIDVADMEALDEMYDEVIEFTAIADDQEVSAAWQRARTRLLSDPCWETTKSYPRCSDCCDDRRDDCEGECDRFALRAGAAGCIGAGIGCAVTELLAPEAFMCCRVGASLVSAAAGYFCYINCRNTWHDCKHDCDKRFP